MSKWDAYHSGGAPPPWESGRPVSQVLAALASGALPRTGVALELGCGNGVTTLALAAAGDFSRVVGLDIAPAAIARARAAEAATAAAGSADAPIPSPLEWVCADLLAAPPSPAAAPLLAACSVVVDVQTFHALRGTAETAPGVARAIAAFLAPGGRLLVLTGNAGEPARLFPGPTLLTAEEVTAPFTAAGLALLSLEETRFDATPAYGDLPPLAWCALFERPPG
jgi:SAM-dependent methyltransferase